MNHFDGKRMQALLLDRGVQISLAPSRAMVLQWRTSCARSNARRTAPVCKPRPMLRSTERTRVAMAKLHVHVVATDLSTTFVTTDGKTRLEAIGALGGCEPFTL